jgi:hypothetical protein
MATASADPVKAYAYVSRAAAQGLAPPRRRWPTWIEVMPLEQRQKGVALAQSMAARKNLPHARVPKPPRKPAPKAACAKPPAAKAPAAKEASAARPGPPWSKRQLADPAGAFGQRKSAEACTPSWPASSRTTGLLYPGRSGRAFAGGSVRKPGAASAACAGLRPSLFPVEAR